MSETAHFGRYSVELTSLDKVLFPDADITKRDLLDYYQAIAPHLLTHIAGRPLTLERYPDGIATEGFFQKEAPGFYPPWIERLTVPLDDGATQPQITVDTRAGLAFLAQQAAVTLHVWTSKGPRLTEPDRMVFDLDPGERTSFATLRDTAELLRARLEEVGLSSHLMTTGSSGLHVWVPLIRGPGFDEVRSFARTVADELVRERPKELTTAARKAAREGRLYIDVNRNGRGQTVVAPYSLRPLPGAPAATPLDWFELPYLQSAQRYSLRSLPARMAQLDDPWKGMGRHAARLERARDAWRSRRG